MATLEDIEKADELIARWVNCVPARRALHEARKQLLEAASVFYANGLPDLGDRYKTMAHQIPGQD